MLIAVGTSCSFVIVMSFNMFDFVMDCFFKEQELLNSGDPQYAHYGGPLHVKVETIAPAHTAYQRIAGVLEALSQTLQPVIVFPSFFFADSLE